MELFEEELTCPICCCLFEDPRVLPCSHNFCKKCLEGILEGSGRSMPWRVPFKCPTCRKETPAAGINNLQVNYSLRGIVEKYNKIRIIPKMPICRQHSGQPLNIFCSTDLLLICGFCATMGDHEGHSFCAIKDAYVEEREAFVGLFRGLETWHSADVWSCLETLESNKKKSLQSISKDADKVMEYFTKLQHTLEQKKNEILSDFETMKLVVMQAYDPEINKLKLILEEQKRAFAIAETFRDVTDPVLFLQQMQEFRNKVKVIKETPLPSYMVAEVHPVMKNFNTCQWDNVRLKDVDKVTLPTENYTFRFKPTSSNSHTFLAISFVCLLIFSIVAFYHSDLVIQMFVSLKTHLYTCASSLYDKMEPTYFTGFFWGEIVDVVSLVYQACKNKFQWLLENMEYLETKCKLF
ncbi:tripartite motif-containing 13 [Callorhinchus milii]|uniref:E3 ubiquitin-protein ligase TRIM13-like protein n=1 Tax=Callorhinchus milii TaxID=7868 RepID=V9KK09_CALMI|nr:tripartite motif-containing 13 [Callorhinchus milii]XP_042190292.1 tripartite motif-containing 13 [Callorhinchus milii]XP_042190293.1 tripartite motif-containing 13 [Callorhinchus milii]|eukprot:gi/632984056/ref/XP_007908951.1/ PREDICTED: E3 ubiquitin-protein ligase TRIM13 [Callorhinchus milii]